ncbi:MAG: hypothetical protein R8G01_10505 [Ilumatobacteraceae bacterium]|nr:hypothetical protein [Ilumatobacteraceae bacterium]
MTECTRVQRRQKVMPHRPRRRVVTSRRQPGVLFQFLASQSVGQAADAITAIVLARLLITGDDDGLDPQALIHTLGVAAVPYAIVGPLSGVVADRWSRRRLLGGAHLARAVTTLAAIMAISLDDRAIGLVAGGLLLSLARLVYTLRAASLPAVAASGRLVEADARSLLVGMLAVLLGASFGALGADGAPVLMLTIACCGQLIGAAGFVTLPRGLGGRSTGPDASIAEIARRLGRLVTSAPTRLAIVLTSLHRSLLGALFVTFVLLAASELGMGSDAYIFALGVSGIGSFAGTLTAPAAARTLGSRRLAIAAFLCPGVVVVAITSMRWPPIIALAVCASFFVFQNLRVSTDATVQAHIASDARARVFSIYDAAYNLSYFGGALVAVTLGAATAPMTAFLTIGSIDLLIGLTLAAGRVELFVPRVAPTKGIHAATSKT